MLERMVGALMFRAETYEEVEGDPSAISQALSIVLLVTVCGIIGGLLKDVMSGEGVTSTGIILGVVGGLFFGILRWAMWVTLLLMIGGGLLRGANTHTSWAELGRVVGFAYTPGVLSILNFIPSIGWLFPVIAFFWTLWGVVVAVRHAMDFDSTGRALAVVLITAVLGFIPWLIILVIQVIILG